MRLLVSLALSIVLVCAARAQQPFFFPIPLQGGSSVQAGTIAIDATTSVTQSTGSNISTQSTPSYTTTSSNDIILALLACGSNTTTPTVSSVTGGALSWLKRSQNINGADHSDIEVWYAQASGIFSSTVTVNWSAACPDPTMIVFGVANVDASTPWDSNVSLPVKTTGSGSSPRTASGIGTTAPITMLLWTIDTSTGNLFGPAPTITGWTAINGTLNVGGCCLGSQWAATKKVTSAQAAASFSETDGAGSIGYAISVDALLSQ